jgi:hypothetical protein
MRHFHFYDETTGVLHGNTLFVNSRDGHEEMAAANCPAGHRPVEGTYDPLSQRIDVATGEAVDYQPPRPSLEHEWSAERRRWLPNVAAQGKAAAAAAARARIAALLEEQHDLVRRAIVDPRDAAARTQLGEIEAQIAALRAQL